MFYFGFHVLKVRDFLFVLRFFVVEDHILHATTGLVTRAFTDELWNMALSKIIAVLRTHTVHRQSRTHAHTDRHICALTHAQQNVNELVELTQSTRTVFIWGEPSFIRLWRSVIFTKFITPKPCLHNTVLKWNCNISAAFHPFVYTTTILISDSKTFWILVWVFGNTGRLCQIVHSHCRWLQSTVCLHSHK